MPLELPPSIVGFFGVLKANGFAVVNTGPSGLTYRIHRADVLRRAAPAYGHRSCRTLGPQEMPLELPPSIVGFFGVLKANGFAVVNTGPSGLTYRIKRKGRDFGARQGSCRLVHAASG